MNTKSDLLNTINFLYKNKIDILAHKEIKGRNKLRES